MKRPYFRRAASLLSKIVLYREALLAQNWASNEPTPILWRSMHKCSFANIFRRTGVAGMHAQAWKRSLVALLAVVMAFGADLPAFSSPAMAGCNSSQQVDVGTQVPHQATNKSAPDMPCKCPMHDCMMVSCCGLATGLMPSDALITPMRKWTDTEQTPELSRTSVSLPPALPPPIDRG